MKGMVRRISKCASPDSHCSVETGFTLVAAALVVILAVSTQVHSAQVKGREELVKAAKEEGQLTIYGSTLLANGRPALDEYFTRAYPGIKVNKTYGPTGSITSRIMTERRAGQYIPDIHIDGTTESLVALKPAGALAPLKTVLLLPEVLDLSGWLYNRLWWADAKEPYTTLMFQGYVQTMVAVNTKMVNPNGIKSYFDLLDPKWKGKMVSNDIRRSGPGGVTARFLYKEPNLGPRYLERLYSEMDITLSSDRTQMVDWLASGRFAIGLFFSPRDVHDGQRQELPITAVPPESFKEGAPIAPGGGAVNAMDRAPHPNAATLFVNWLLSKEGQVRWQETQVLPSLRVDIPKDGLFPIDVPKPGVKYIAGGVEEYSGITPAVFRELISRALEKSKGR